MADEHELDIELRLPAEVGERCIVLAAMIRRLSIESLAETEGDERLAGEAFDIRGWLQTEGLWSRLTAAEGAFLDRPVGGLDDDELAAVAWQIEGLVALGWALGLTELPDLGDLSLVEPVIRSVPNPWDQSASWLRSSVLLPEPDIARERDRAEILEWRIGLEVPRRSASGHEDRDFTRAIADVVSEAIAAGFASDVHDGDFTVVGKPVTTHAEADLERLAVLAEERLRALNWLCGFGNSWDDVPLDP